MMKMLMKTAQKTEFGDWQTPAELAREICLILTEKIKPNLVLEPNCGKGAFLRAAVEIFHSAGRFVGIDINKDYVCDAKTIECDALEIEQGDFFTYDWNKYLNDSSGSILVLGNPPWVTNTELMRLESGNVPRKSNFEGLRGIDAVTGKSNFDISEWMLIKETEALQGKDALLAMLCKTVIARKVVTHAWKHSFHFDYAEIRQIDAQKHFGVAVDACLLLIRFQTGSSLNDGSCQVYESLDAKTAFQNLGLRNGRIVSDVDTIDRYSDLIMDGTSPYCWRSGIKHDCSQVMELSVYPDGSMLNGLGESVDIEDGLLFPMLKSSDLANDRIEIIKKVMLVPQRCIGDDTNLILHVYPRTWKYLEDHTEFFDKRKSTIYRNKPRFSIFGVGEYAFEPWKVAISGLYKSLKFRAIGPFEGKPVVFDDTCYFFACHSEEEAVLTKDLLESKICSEILQSFIFWDSKRPITAEILNRLDLSAIARFSGIKNTYRGLSPGYLNATQQTLF